ncbi:MAG: GNAT family N-acetyltransferase [Bacteroidota bacterium]
MMKLKMVDSKQKQQLQALCRVAYTQHFANHWEADGLELYLENQFGTSRLDADLRDPKVGYYFIYSNQQAAGFLKIQGHAALEGQEDLNCSELEKIYLLKEFAGQGLGKQALQQIITILRQQEVDLLFLCVIDTNLTAIAFYQKLGFQFHSKTILDVPSFKEELKGMHRMILYL